MNLERNVSQSAEIVQRGKRIRCQAYSKLKQTIRLFSRAELGFLKAGYVLTSAAQQGAAPYPRSVKNNRKSSSSW